jgi:hypothetical protein
LGLISIKLWVKILRYAITIGDRVNSYVLAVSMATVTFASIILLPYSVGTGHLLVEKLVNNDAAIPLIILTVVLIVRLAVSAMIVGFGGSGGLFAPGLVAGGIIGYLFSKIYSPIIGVDATGVLVLAGMAGFYGGVSSTPLGTGILVAELTGNYAVIIPLLTGTLISREIAGDSRLYWYQRNRRLHPGIGRLRNIYELLLARNPGYGNLMLTRYRGFGEKLFTVNDYSLRSDPLGIFNTMIISKNDLIGLTRRGRLIGIVSLSRLTEKIGFGRSVKPVKMRIFSWKSRLSEVVDYMTRENTPYIILYGEGSYHVLRAEKLSYALLVDYSMGIT